MSAGKLNLAAEQGATFQLTITYKESGVAVDLTGYTARMQVRPSKTSETITVELTTENGRISIPTPANGEILLSIEATVMEAIDEDQYVYDLELITGSVVKRLIEGRFCVTGEVTR